MKPNQVYCKPTYYEGLYVTRIKVCPNDASKVYLHTNGSEYFLSGFKENHKEISVKRLRKVIKQKISKKLHNDRLLFKDRSVEYPLSHSCAEPDSGVIIDSKGTGKGGELQGETCISFEDEFPHMSMIICKAKYLKTIK